MEETSIADINYIKEREHEFRRLMLMYNSALKEMETKIQIISDEFQMLYSYNPIEHIKTRIKSPESIIKKLKKFKIRRFLLHFWCTFYAIMCV